ncbi:hypothetical protein [Marinobacter subterrani]|uniref:hypothetical protein n=1 Tax=Marinobacter subterrani TaxID=1658765 RepID=UPI000ACA5C71|nr:hypothetical protein [Marinobacter subterrani]
MWKLPDDYAGLPHDLNNKLPAKTGARLRAVFCLPATTETAPEHNTKSTGARHLTLG